MVRRRLRRHRRVMFGDPGTAPSLVEGGGGDVGFAAAQGLSGAVVAAREEDSFADRVLSVWDSRLMVGRWSMRCRHMMFGDWGRKRGLVEGGSGNIESAAAGGRSGVVVAARKVDHFGIIRVWLVWNGILMVQSSLMWRRRVMFIVIPVAMIGEHVDNSKKECSFLALLQNI
jgi:hypothetical protein